MIWSGSRNIQNSIVNRDCRRNTNTLHTQIRRRSASRRFEQSYGGSRGLGNKFPGKPGHPPAAVSFFPGFPGKKNRAACNELLDFQVILFCPGQPDIYTFSWKFPGNLILLVFQIFSWFTRKKLQKPSLKFLLDFQVLLLFPGIPVILVSTWISR